MNRFTLTAVVCVVALLVLLYYAASRGLSTPAALIAAVPLVLLVRWSLKRNQRAR